MDIKNLPKINVKLNTDILSSVQPVPITANLNMEKMIESVNESKRMERLKQQEKEERELQLLEIVQQIMKNTAYLPEMVGLIRKNNEVNEEMLELYKEMTNVLKAQTEEEAEGIFTSVIERAKNTKDAIDAIVALSGYGKLLLQFLNFHS
jgi:hypothetical protein